MQEIQIRKVETSNNSSIISIACSFKSDIFAVVDGQKYNAKSIMNATIIKNASNIDFIIDGEDEAEAKDVIKKFYGQK